MGKKYDGQDDKLSSTNKTRHEFDPYKKPCNSDDGEMDCHESVKNWYGEDYDPKVALQKKSESQQKPGTGKTTKRPKAKTDCSEVTQDNEVRYKSFLSDRRDSKASSECPQEKESHGLDVTGTKSCKEAGGRVQAMVCPEPRYKVPCVESDANKDKKKDSCKENEDRIDLCGEINKTSCGCDKKDDCKKVISCKNLEGHQIETKNDSSSSYYRKLEDIVALRFEEARQTPCIPAEKHAYTQEDKMVSQTVATTDSCETPYSRVKSLCRNIANEFMKPRTDDKFQCNNKDQTLQETSCIQKPESTKLPCHPKVEKGAPTTPACCVSRDVASSINEPTRDAFFSIDALNKQLNQCIKKYNADPNLVATKCSKFANEESAMKKCESSLQSEKFKSSGKLTTGTSFLTPKRRQLARRWGPSAAIYFTTSALLTVYLTEWKAALRHVPGYRSKVLEDAAQEE